MPVSLKDKMHHILQKLVLWRLWSFQSISFVCSQFCYYYYDHHHHHHFFSKWFSIDSQVDSGLQIYWISDSISMWIPEHWNPESISDSM